MSTFLNVCFEIRGQALQLVEQGLGLLQVDVEAFGEPAVDRSEKIPGLIPLAQIAKEPRHAHRRAQFGGAGRRADYGHGVSVIGVTPDRTPTGFPLR